MNIERLKSFWILVKLVLAFGSLFATWQENFEDAAALLLVLAFMLSVEILIKEGE